MTDPAEADQKRGITLPHFKRLRGRRTEEYTRFFRKPPLRTRE